MAIDEGTGRHGVCVWDPVVRIGHWLLVLTVASAWFTRQGWGIWHEVVGYAALAIVILRLMWGVLGSHHARFRNFVRGFRATLTYAGQTYRRTEPRHIGHNPMGAWMIIALIVVTVAVCFSGWLYTTDRYWGIEWVEILHAQLSNLLLALIAVHIIGVLYASYRHDENLIASMLHGHKRN